MLFFSQTINAHTLLFSQTSPCPVSTHYFVFIFPILFKLIGNGSLHAVGVAFDVLQKFLLNVETNEDKNCSQSKDIQLV